MMTLQDGFELPRAEDVPDLRPEDLPGVMMELGTFLQEKDWAPGCYHAFKFKTSEIRSAIRPVLTENGWHVCNDGLYELRISKGKFSKPETEKYYMHHLADEAASALTELATLIRAVRGKWFPNDPGSNLAQSE